MHLSVPFDSSYNGGVESIVFGIQRTWLGSRLCYFNSCMTLENLLHFVGRQFSYIYGFSNYKKKKKFLRIQQNLHGVGMAGTV